MHKVYLISHLHESLGNLFNISLRRYSLQATHKPLYEVLNMPTEHKGRGKEDSSLYVWASITLLGTEADVHNLALKKDRNNQYVARI